GCMRVVTRRRNRNQSPACEGRADTAKLATTGWCARDWHPGLRFSASEPEAEADVGAHAVPEEVVLAEAAVEADFQVAVVHARHQGEPVGDVPVEADQSGEAPDALFHVVAVALLEGWEADHVGAARLGGDADAAPDLDLGAEASAVPGQQLAELLDVAVVLHGERIA